MTERVIEAGRPGPGPAGASGPAIRRHYDAGNAFYEAWLDPTRTYSCALWSDEPGQTLEQAQYAKLDWVKDFFAKHQARDVLDIGCGWGGMLRHLTLADEQIRGVGLTLSATQHAFVEGQEWPRVKVCLEGWEDHAQGPYDAIVSIGAFEHFARLEHTPEERLERYRSFFRSCFSKLPLGGPLALQTIAYGAAPHSAAGNAFFAEIFPESDCPRLEEILAAAGGLFELVELRNDREHYTRTLKAWLSNLRANQEQAIAASSFETVELYRKYLGMSAVGFHTNTHALLRMRWRRL